MTVCLFNWRRAQEQPCRTCNEGMLVGRTRRYSLDRLRACIFPACICGFTKFAPAVLHVVGRSDCGCDPSEITCQWSLQERSGRQDTPAVQHCFLLHECANSFVFVACGIPIASAGEAPQGIKEGMCMLFLCISVCLSIICMFTFHVYMTEGDSNRQPQH